jgi:DNA-binding NarL/FixJ family response regulator
LETVRILVADDHEIVRRGVCALLARESDLNVVCETADGIQAVAKAKEHQPDLIVLDISMPGMDGFEAARQIRRISPASEVVFLSQHDSLEVVRQAFLAGARGYVVKSDIAQELLTALRDAMQKKHYLNRRLKEQVKRMGAAAGLGISF